MELQPFSSFVFLFDLPFCEQANTGTIFLRLFEPLRPPLFTSFGLFSYLHNKFYLPVGLSLSLSLSRSLALSLTYMLAKKEHSLKALNFNTLASAWRMPFKDNSVISKIWCLILGWLGTVKADTTIPKVLPSKHCKTLQFFIFLLNEDRTHKN